MDSNIRQNEEQDRESLMRKDNPHRPTKGTAGIVTIEAHACTEALIETRRTVSNGNSSLLFDSGDRSYHQTSDPKPSMLKNNAASCIRP